LCKKEEKIQNMSTRIEPPANSLTEPELVIGPKDFKVHAILGKGSFGEVYLVEKIDDKKIYAMKVLYKNNIISKHNCLPLLILIIIVEHNLTRYALTEKNVLSNLNHPFIVKLHYSFQTPSKLFMILDFCPGGDLGEHLQVEHRFTEDRAKIYICEILTALEHLHKNNIIYRDLKPDNIVLDIDGHAMLTDFGLSKEEIIGDQSGAKSFCGSVAYLAPEMLKRNGHGKAVDWYLLGVVLYEMLVGLPPYYAESKDELFKNIECAELRLPSRLSSDVRDLLTKVNF
jgi:serine/threonine protein kinase